MPKIYHDTINKEGKKCVSLGVKAMNVHKIKIIYIFERSQKNYRKFKFCEKW